MTHKAKDVRVSEKLVAAVKLGREPAYRLAMRAGLDPTVLSKWLHGAVRVRPDDPRVHRLAECLGLRPEEAVVVEHRSAARSRRADSGGPP